MKLSELIEQTRRDHPALPKTVRGDFCGYFTTRGLNMIASDGSDWPCDGQAWEHVSVSTPTRCPTWSEMCWVKRQFWAADECVVQFHPPDAVYVNHHQFCLHLWKPVGVVLTLPPLWTLGPKTVAP